MGLTPAGGLTMSTRAGDLDPGVVVYLARQHGLTIDRIDEWLTQRSGLAAISGGTSDMQELLARESADPRARLAVDVFCARVRQWIGAFSATLGGLDTIVFTAGIGEHAPAVRQRACDGLGFLGVSTDDAAKVAGHSGKRTTAVVYDRAVLEAAGRFADARIQGREQSGNGGGNGR